MEYDKLADEESIERTVKALKENGVNVEVVENRNEARKKVLELIPEKSEVMTMTSMTLQETGIDEEINKSGKFNAVRDKLYSMDSKTKKQEMNKLGAAPEYVLGSIHALTEDGKLIIASATGSQIPAYVYGAGKAIFIIGSQKIVKNLDEGMKRIYEYVFPLEDERARKAYGVGSGVNKLLIINKEVQEGRINVILVKEKLGF